MKLTPEQKAFMAVLKRLGAIFTNLDFPSDETVAEWYRVFKDVPNPVLHDAVGRAVQRHDATRLQPAAFRRFVDEALTDHRNRLDAQAPEVVDDRCSDPTCPKCGGTGTFTREIEVGGQKHVMTIVCEKAPKTDESEEHPTT